MALPLAGPYGGQGLATSIVVAGGLTTPSLEAGLRALWPSVLPDPRLRHAALALDTGTQGLLGPCSSPSSPPRTAPPSRSPSPPSSAWPAPPVVVLAPPSRRWRPTPSVGNLHGAAGRLNSSGLVLLFVSLTGIGFAIGAMNVWSIAMAEHHEQDMLSGIIPAAFSTGSFLGGLIYGRRTWSRTTADRLIIASAAFLAGWLPLATQPAPFAATAAVAAPGAFLTVVVACAYVTTDALAPAGRTSEAYAWLILSIGVGQSAGTALAGRLAEQTLASAALPATGAAFALAVLLAAHRQLRPTGQLPRGRHRRPFRGWHKTP